MKQLVISCYRDSATFFPNNRVNESDIFFLTNINAAEIPVNLKNQGIMTVMH